MKFVFLLLSLSLGNIALAESSDSWNAGVEKLLYKDHLKDRIFSQQLNTPIENPKVIKEILYAASRTSHCQPRILDDYSVRAALAAGIKISRIEIVKGAAPSRTVVVYFEGYTKNEINSGRGFANSVCEDI